MTSSDSIEATAATVDEAISQALDQLGAHSDDVTIEVLSTPRSGVLGLGARLARVRVTRHVPAEARSTVQSPPPAPPLKRTPPELSRQTAPRPERRPVSPSETRAPSADEPAAASGESHSEDAGQPRATETAGSRPRERRRSAELRADNDDSARRESPRESSTEGRRRDSRTDDRRDDRPRRDRDRPRASGDSHGNRSENRLGARSSNEIREGEPRSNTAPRQRRAEAHEADRRAEAESQVSAELDIETSSLNDDGADNDQRDSIAPEEQITEAIKIAAEVLEMMGEQAIIETVRDETLQTVELNIRGDGSGVLIGRHGQTLDALEYIVNRILGRRIKDALAVSLDTESYRARRRGQLHRMALSKGEQAKREHVTVRLDPMPPRDRRIVHLALKDDPLITTRSSGEGFLRSIEIVPVNGSWEHDRGERGNRERRARDTSTEGENDDLPLGEQGGFKHGQKRIV